ncbi:MAG: hypothetical protein AAFU84_10730, partial [Cyanobacteria bacterium J06633_23]
EIYLKLNGKKIWPGDKYQNIKRGMRLDINVSHPYNGDSTLELWEYDSTSSDDLLGSVSLNEFTNGVHSSSAKGDSGDYTIQYAVA